MDRGSWPRVDSGTISTSCTIVGGRTGFSSRVPLNTTVTLATQDASGGQIREDVPYGQVDERDLFPVTGCIEVLGVERDDLLAIDIEQIDLDDTGYCWTRPGIGRVRVESYIVRAVERRAPFMRLNGKVIPLRVRPHLGTLGLAPASPSPARDVGRHGGNIDSYLLEAGSTLVVSSQQGGGGLYAGDAHLGIGDAEVCGTGIEIGARVTLRVRKVDGFQAPLPVIINAEQAWAIGIGSTTDQAIESAVSYATERVARMEGVSLDEAYLAVGQLMVLRVCQVVNPHVSVALSLHGGLDRALNPARSGDAGEGRV